MLKLRKNIDNLMKEKGIRDYADLLANIAKQLGFQKPNEISAFVGREKSNFSKMLQGKRPLKYEFIVPLETLFATPLSRIINKDAYLLPVDKGSIPFDKGFRYYAYLDDYDLYVDEFDKKLDKNGRQIICNMDEFGKTFLDYVVEYGAKNAVRYLHNIYEIKLQWALKVLECSKSKHLIPTPPNIIGFVRLVAGINDAELFFNIFDSYNMFFTNGHYGDENSLYNLNEYHRILLDNDNLFNDLFVIKPYDFEITKKQDGIRIKKIQTLNLPNPILNNCLKYSLKNLDKYKEQAKRILEFGLDYNKKIDKHLINDKFTASSYYIADELGGVRNINDKDFLGFAIIADGDNVRDKEILSLINKLPKFNK